MTINAVVITDKNYFPFLKVTLLSLVKNTHNNLRIYCILSEKLEIADRRWLENFESTFDNINMEVIDYSLEKIEFKAKNHVSKAAFIKIDIPIILQEINKVIYLDSDLLIQGDLTDLWSEFEDGVPLKGCWNPNYNYDNHTFNQNLEHKTFNSGVLLLDLELMRRNNSNTKLRDFIIENNEKTRLNDQAAFNAIFQDWSELPLSWNVQYIFYQHNASYFEMSKQELYKLKKSPKIVHFTTNSKPWMIRNAHPFKKEYLRYLRKADESFVFEDASLISLVKRIKEFLVVRWFCLFN
ncbi:glycosyltransferase family 8 protein [Enterococcus dispar]|uniref:glycosyltransferase family 8 protein n=1 Tax=Enterococcus dispar TaxID=44009 RepID=UPI002891036F|nr:glycosyltransferase family 8 protein [Enterococcus dispar]MDT2706162.1 glycosyltransferase family 8 protein [Enterococcus dispar]